MTARQRHRREARIRRAMEEFATTPEHLRENPNNGHRRAARLDTSAAESARIDAARRDYRPLMVSTPVRDSRGRRNPRMRPTSYTV